MNILERLPSSILDRVEPALLLYMAIETYVSLLISEFWHRGRIPPDIREKAFGTFWSKISGAPPEPSVPLVGSAALVPPLFAQARGVVLEVGPGSGNQAGLFNVAEANIEKVYGAEPAIELHNLIRKNVDNTLIGPKYTILGANASRTSIAHELVRSDIIRSTSDAKGIFDTILCVRVLCSVPDLDGTVADLHALLRPGGKLLICEHTINQWTAPGGSIVSRLFQWLYMLLGWSYFIGDCSLTRDTEAALRRDSTSRWASINIERHFRRRVLTYISGILVKQ